MLTVEKLIKIQEKTRIVLGMRDRTIYSKNIFETLYKNEFKGAVDLINDAGHDIVITHKKFIIDLLNRSEGKW